MIYGVGKVDVTLMKKNGCLITFESGQQMNTLFFPPIYAYCSFLKTIYVSESHFLMVERGYLNDANLHNSVK